jgi:hypothetical protein
MAGVISKICNWMRELRLFFLKLINRLQSLILRSQKSDENAIKLFWIEDRRIKICEEIFVVDLEILAYIQRSKPTTFDEKLQKLVQEKKDLIDSWRNPTLPENLDDLPTDNDRRRQLCVQRAERCKQLYDSLAGFKKLYNETVEEVGIVLTYDEKLHFTKPFSLFDPTCTCCFLEIEFHFPPLPSSKVVQPKKYEEENSTSETAPLLGNQDDDIPDEPSQPLETDFYSPMSKQSADTSSDTFLSCEPTSESDEPRSPEMKTIRTGSGSTMDKDFVDDDSTDATWYAEDGDSSRSLSTATEGSVHLVEDSSDEEAANDKSDNDEYIGGMDDAVKENYESKDSNGFNHSFRD